MKDNKINVESFELDEDAVVVEKGSSIKDFYVKHEKGIVRGLYIAIGAIAGVVGMICLGNASNDDKDSGSDDLDVIDADSIEVEEA